MNDLQTQNSKPAIFLSSVGLLAGLYYAFKNEKGFWAYVGYGLLGSIAGTTAGSIVSLVKSDKA